MRGSSDLPPAITLTSVENITVHGSVDETAVAFLLV